jgi:Holliday junction DNA helicase RuvB
MKDDVTAALLTICNPNDKNSNTLVTDEHRLHFDFSRQSFMFATTEAHKVFDPLMDRCERVDLEEYSHEEMAKIIKLNLKEIDFEGGLLKTVASVLRGNARKAQQMAVHIKSHLSFVKRNAFDSSDWDSFRDELDILPLGVNRSELNILEKLDDKTNASLTYLAATTGISKYAIQRDMELYLQKHDLMEISTAGRNITPKGKEYLRELNSLNRSV